MQSPARLVVTSWTLLCWSLVIRCLYAGVVETPNDVTPGQDCVLDGGRNGDINQHLGTLTTPGYSMNATCTGEQGHKDLWYVSANVTSYNGNGDDFCDEFDCDDVHAKPRPSHNHSTWMLLRGAYISIVGPNYATIDMERLSENGFHVKVEVAHIPGKGRGVVALEDIPEGTFVWDTLQTARFPSAVEFRRFLISIPEDLACDVLIWAYVEVYSFEAEEGTGPRPVLSVDLDEASFMNTINAASEKNIDNDTGKTNRLVKAGEELLVDYKAFEVESDWDVVGFGWPVYEARQNATGARF